MQKKWLENIYHEIAELSDSEMQRRLWLGKDSKYISSYDELLCSLFDDFNFDLFIDNELPKIEGLTPSFIQSIRKLREMFNEYDRKNLNDEQIIEDPEWLKVVEQAKMVEKQWNENIKMN